MTNPIRVAQIVGKMNGGGVEAVVMNYYRHIDRLRVQFDFLVDADSTLVPRDEIESLGGRVFVIPPYQKVFNYQRELKRLFTQEKWQIVHSHINALSVFPLRAAKKANVPVRIAHSHSSNGGGKGEVAKDILKSILKTQSLRYPNYLLACGDLAGKWLFGEGASFTVFPNAVDLSQFAPDDSIRSAMRCELGIDDKTFVVGHIGRMVPQKNHSFLLDIFSSLLELEPNSLLLLAGDGPLLDEIEAKAAYLGNKVKFLGQRSDAASLYQVFDVFCLPSVYEGLPVVGVECQASGTPILASDAITSEARLTSLMEFEQLSSSPKKWCEHLISMRKIDADPNDSESLKAFDVSAASKRLEDYYSHCLKTVSPSKAIADK